MSKKTYRKPIPTDLENAARRAVCGTLKTLNDKAKNERIAAIQREWWRTDSSTIYADLLQAARLALFEYGDMQQMEYDDIIEQSRNGRDVTPYDKACAAVSKEITFSNHYGITGDIYGLRQLATVSLDTEDAPSPFYYEDTDEIEIEEAINKLFDNERKIKELIALLKDGYTVPIAAEKLNIPRASAYRLRDTIKKRLLDSGDLDHFK